MTRRRRSPGDESRAAIVPTPEAMARRDWQELTAEARRDDPSRLAYALAQVAAGRAEQNLPADMVPEVFDLLRAEHRRPGRARALSALQAEALRLYVHMKRGRIERRLLDVPPRLFDLAAERVRRMPVAAATRARWIGAIKAARWARPGELATRMRALRRLADRAPRLREVLIEHGLLTVARCSPEEVTRRARAEAIAAAARRFNVSAVTARRLLRRR